MRRSFTLLGCLTLLLPWCWFYGLPVSLGESFAYRDVAHYYFPFWHFVANCWRDVFAGTGQIPLWNPFDNGGQPLAADATACVFYPGVWLLALPLPYSLAFKLLIGLHALGAAVAMLLVARRLGRSWPASTLAALSYAFGGYVVAQHANVVFLISAMWLPLVMYFGQRIWQRGTWKHGLGLSATLAMMILGGDPQTAYHCSIALLLYLAVLGFHRRGENPHEPKRALAYGLMWLVVSFAAAAGLAAVQILPAAEFARHSSRSHYETPRSVWERWFDARDFAVDEGPDEGRAGDVVAGSESHAAQVYDYSFAPWRILELVWPNCAGRVYPVHARWTKAALGEHQVWIPSVFFGLLPCILAISACRGFRQPSRRWLILITLLALLSAWGAYGFGALLNALARWIGAEVRVDSFLGGLYWSEVQLLPGYALFRYPSKWLVLFAWSTSLLAAEGWDEIRSGQQVFPHRWLVVLASITGVLLLGLLLGRGYWEQLVRHAAADQVFGPLDRGRAWLDLNLSLLQCIVALGVIGFCTRQGGLAKHWQPAALLLLTACELIVAHQWQLETVADRALHGPSKAWDIIRAAHRQPAERIRILREVTRPPEWRRASSVRRLDEVVTWDRATLSPKYHLNHAHPQLVHILSGGSMVRADLLLLLDTWQRDPEQLSRQRTMLGSFYEITHRATNVRAKKRLSLGADFIPPSSDAPRAWIAYQYRRGAPPPQSRRFGAWRRWCRETLQIGNDLERVPLVHDAIPAPPLRHDRSWPITPVACQDPHVNAVVMSVRLPRAGLLVLRDGFFPGWRADILTGERRWSADVQRVNVVQRGVLLPAGTHRVVLRYEPPSFQFGAWISVLAWLAWLAAGLALVIRAGRASTRAGVISPAR